MELKTIIDMFQKINRENTPVLSKMTQEEYNKHITNQFVRNIITDIACIGGFDSDGDTMSIQGIKVAFNLQTGTFKYVHDDRFPEKVFKCIYNHNDKDYDLIIFANKKEELMDILRSRLVIIRPDIINTSECMSSLVERAYKGCSFISRQTKNINIEDAYEITNPDDCRIYEDKDKLTLWLA